MEEKALDETKMAGKRVLVTGSGTGIGREIGLEFARAGADVVFHYAHSSQGALSAAEEARRLDVRTTVLAADFSRVEEVQQMTRQAIDFLGGIDILVNNAGGPPSTNFLEIDDTLWEYGFRLNLMSTIVMTREAVPVMKEKKWGRIINMTSIAVKQPIDGLILSNTVRSGVIGLAKSLSNELAPFNITVNSVCPGYTLTDRVRNLAKATAEKEKTTPEAIIKRWESSIPMGRLGTPEEFASLVAFLASEHSGYITGAAIQIDGGWYKGIM